MFSQQYVTPTRSGYFPEPPSSDFASEPSPFSFPPIGMPQNDGAQHTGDELIGRPIYFTQGPFEGRTVRAELLEIQKADLGRKSVPLAVP